MEVAGSYIALNQKWHMLEFYSFLWGSLVSILLFPQSQYVFL